MDRSSERFPGESSTYGWRLMINVWEIMKQMEKNGRTITVKNVARTLEERGINVPENEKENVKERVGRNLFKLHEERLVRRRAVPIGHNLTQYVYEIERPYKP